MLEKPKQNEGIEFGRDAREPETNEGSNLGGIPENPKQNEGIEFGRDTRELETKVRDRIWERCQRT